MKYKLRDYQIDGVESIRDGYRKGAKSILYVLPTGGGKTIVFSYITEKAYEKGKSILILTHRNTLLLQASEKIKSMGLNHGIIASGYKSLRYRIQVASVQTLVKRLQYWKHFDFIIIDECHHTPAGSWEKIYNHFSNASFLGVTATAIRLDGKGLGNFFEHMIIGPSYQYLIDNRYLSIPYTYRPEKNNSDEKYLTGCAIKHYSQLMHNQSVIVFCCNNNHAENVKNQFCDSGFNFVCITQKTPYNRRKKYLDLLANNKIHGITSCDVISEGTDVPGCNGVIMLRPSDSLGLVHQQQGRCLRIADGKDKAIILDHASNTYRHGFITDTMEWKLTKKKYNPNIDKSEKKRCERCDFCYPIYKKECPECGYVNKSRKKHEPEQRQGRLVLANDYTKINEEILTCKTYYDFYTLAKKYNYRPGWASYQWQNFLKKMS